MITAFFRSVYKGFCATAYVGILALTTLSAAEGDALYDVDWSQIDDKIDPNLFLSPEPLDRQFRKSLIGNQSNYSDQGGASVETRAVKPSTLATTQKRTLDGASVAAIPVFSESPTQKSSLKRIGANEKPLSHSDNTLAQANFQLGAQQPAPLQPVPQSKRPTQPPVSINFNNVAVTEYIRFVSRLANKNFIYDENDLLFNVTIVSEQPVTIDEIMSALLQVLRIHDLSIIEEGDDYLIHRNPAVKTLPNVVIDNYGVPPIFPSEAEIITQVIQLNTLDANTAQNVISSMMSARGIVEVFRDSNHMVISDFATNVHQIAQILKGVDAPASSVTVGQYVVRNTSIDILIELLKEIMRPIAKEQPFTLIPQGASNSIFIMTTPFLMERALPILYRLDQVDATTGVFDLRDMQFLNYDSWKNAIHTPEGGFPSGFGPGGAGGPGGLAGGALGGAGALGEGFLQGLKGHWQLDNRGRWIFHPGLLEGSPGSFSNPFIPGLRGSIATPGAPPVPYEYTMRGQAAAAARRAAGVGAGQALPGAAGAPLLQGPETTPLGAVLGSISAATGTPPPILTGAAGAVGVESAVLRAPVIIPPELVTPGSVQVPPPEGYWRVDQQGSWFFQPGKPPEAPSGPVPPGGLPPSSVVPEGELVGPRGQWMVDDQGLWIFELAPGDSIFSSQKARFGRLNPNLPVGFVERTKFMVYKLQFRKADAVEEAIKKIGLSLIDSEAINAAFIATINSVQALLESNSMVISGPPEEIDKVAELIAEIDQPLRQVFIEMLILDTTVDDSLNYGVNWITRFGGGNTVGAQGFVAGASNLGTVLNTTGLVTANGVVTAASPDPTNIVSAPGYTLGIIGQHIIHKAFGLEFNSIGALVNALHEKNTANIILNPKILTEDGIPAEIFVGINTQFRTQSVANDQGSVITSNFEFRDIGTRLTVTPTLGPSNIITLDISEEVSNVITNPVSGGNAGGGTGGSALLSDQGAGPTTSKNTTKTKVHVPDGFFLVMSGMIQEDDSRLRDQVPCLGGIPLLGGLFSFVRNVDSKRNLMIFIRPKLIDTEEEMVTLTRRQQDIYKVKRRNKPMWRHEVDGAIDFLNMEDYLDCGKPDLMEFEYNIGDEAARVTETAPGNQPECCRPRKYGPNKKTCAKPRSRRCR